MKRSSATVVSIVKCVKNCAVRKILVLIVIYLAFISLGLPDSILGAAWPAMYGRLQVPAHFAGVIYMIIAGGTVVSSLWSAPLINRFGVARVTTISVVLTGLALLGFSYSGRFLYLCLLAIPLGLGGGCVDAALNNYVALHYKARHMNWLHCFWGIGAAAGPLIMGYYLAAGDPWNSGYQTIGSIQLSLALLLLLSIPFWIDPNRKSSAGGPAKTSVFSKRVWQTPGLKEALLTFFLYCTIEATFGLWGASYLVFERGFDATRAARLTAFYYGGITAGRFLTGFLTRRFNNRQLVYMGQGFIALGIILLALPWRPTLMAGFVVVGLGCAPVFPSLLHETPRNFGETFAPVSMGLQMAAAYVGITAMPFLFGLFAAEVGYRYLPVFILITLVAMGYAHVQLNRKVYHRKHATL